jgi:hypothetical protein
MGCNLDNWSRLSHLSWVMFQLELGVVYFLGHDFMVHYGLKDLFIIQQEMGHH